MAYLREAPVFCDGEMRPWISWMEQYFDRRPLMEFGKITVTRRFLRGEAARYIDELDSFERFRFWKEMKNKLVLKFGADDDPEKIRLGIESARGYSYRWNRDPWESFVGSRPQRHTLESPKSQNHFRETQPLLEQQLQSMDSKLDNTLRSIDSKLQAIENHLDSRFESIRKALGKHPVEPYRPESSVHHRNWEQNPGSSSLGYRYGPVNAAIRDSMLRKVEMPVFSGMNALDWIMDVEHFFELGHYQEEEKLDLVSLCVTGEAKEWFNWMIHRDGFGSWPRFKRQLMIRFAKPINMDRLVHELQMRNKTASSTVEQISVNDLGCPVTACSPPTVNPSASIPEIVQELDTLLKKDSCLENDDEAELSSAIVSTDNFAADASLEHESEQSTYSPATILEGKQLMSQRLNVIAVEEREEMPQYWSDILKPAIADETCKHSSDETEENVQLSQDWTIKSTPYCAYQHVTRKARKVTRKHKQSKFYKTWTFKFKEKLPVQKLRDASIAQPYPPHVQKLVDVRFQVKHKWRSKLLTQASVLVFVLEQAAGLRIDLQPSGFCHSGYLSISISLSLWSSLISRAGVYKGKLACCLIVDAVIWLLLPTSESDILEKDVGKQRKKEELTYGMVQVVNHQLLKEKGSLLIHSKRHLLHIMIHQTKAWRKFYKTRMFKYKAGVSQVQVLL